MFHKIFAALVVLIALVIAVLVSVLPQEKLAGLFYISRFIEVMIPVLGAGALVKYLFSCGKRKCCVCATKTDVITTRTV